MYGGMTPKERKRAERRDRIEEERYLSRRHFAKTGHDYRLAEATRRARLDAELQERAAQEEREASYRQIESYGLF